MNDTFWHPWTRQHGPLAGALLFGVCLAGLAIWFSGSDHGAWIAFFGLSCALVLLAILERAALMLILPLMLGLSAFGLILFGGGLMGAALPAALWPMLALISLGDAHKHHVRQWLGPGLAASITLLVCLFLIDARADIPASARVSGAATFLALGVCMAFAVSALISSARRNKHRGSLSQQEAGALAQSRDAALQDARLARTQTQEHAQFMAEMSHEIRTPLNAILGFADTMRAQVFGPLPGPYQDYPELIHKSGAHLLEIVSDLLDLSKIEAGRYEANLGPIDLSALINEGVGISSGAARVGGVNLRAEAPQPLFVMGDARAVRQIIFNLVSNAIKFTPSGGHAIVRLVRHSGDDFATLEVQDDGVGMSETDLARVGEAWNQVKQAADDGQNRRVRGSGLGLALVKRLAELQRAEFSISSTLGSGTTARVRFQALPTSSRQAGDGLDGGGRGA